MLVRNEQTLHTSFCMPTHACKCRCGLSPLWLSEHVFVASFHANKQAQCKGHVRPMWPSAWVCHNFLECLSEWFGHLILRMS